MKDNNLKILVDANVIDGFDQGTKTYLVGLWNQLRADDGIKIYIACSNKKKFDQYFNETEYIRFLKMPNFGSLLRLFIFLPILSWKYKVDFIHSNYISPFFSYGKKIVTTHDILFIDYPAYFPKSFSVLRSFLFKYSAKKADILTTVSKYSKSRLEYHYGIDSNDIVVTPNGVSLERFVNTKKVADIEPDKFFLYVSRIEPRKNQVSLIDAFEKIDSNFKLVFVGSRAIEYPEFDKLILESPSKHRIKIISASDAELGWLYNNCKACFYPSFCEGFGIPPIESSKLGALTFISNNTALSEILEYVNGSFIADDINAIHKIMHSLVRGHNDTNMIEDPNNFPQNQWRLSLDYLLKKLNRSSNI